MKKVAASSVFDVLSRFRVYFQGDTAVQNYGQEEPFHSELYSSDKMNRHSKAIARSHTIQTDVRRSDQLLRRLDKNETMLLEVRNLLVTTIKAGKTVTPGAEWLLDNFYLIEEQITLARKHLPRGYSEGLPYLSNGIAPGTPRVYNIALEIISHSDGRVDHGNLAGFIKSYQSVAELTLGELWAIPIMIRLAVIENLRRVCGRLALDMTDYNLAEYWAGRMIDTVRGNAGDLILTISDMVRSKPILSSPFVAAFARSLQSKGSAFALPLSWMEEQLARVGTSSSDLVYRDSQKQAADQVSVRNSIGTLRFIGATDWREFVETLSSVEQILKLDPAGVYPLMDFATRDRYRHVVETIAKYATLSETDVARRVIELAQGQQGDEPQVARRRHVGYFLIGKGLEQAERAAGMQYTLKQRLTRIVGKRPVFIYLSSIIVLTLLAAFGMYYVALAYGQISSILLRLLVALVCAIGASQLAVSLVNWISAVAVKPKKLPRMDFSRGIPVEYRTLVTIPSLLPDKDHIEELIEGLEIRFLANNEDNLYFALLTDFPDADREVLPGDDQLLELVSNRIRELNDKYRRGDQDVFFLFHRPRLWNPSERKWMGYERKRGKLIALNALLKGRETDDFSRIIGDHRGLTNVKYVITLDSDTRLPRESAWKFVAAMAHPLNQPYYDPKKRRVTEGYAILQPRVELCMPHTTTSLYLNMLGGLTGIDPYTRVSSDVYQDLFGEGSYIGKGIYDLEVFQRVVHGVFPENRILSHDLLEGCYARSGLLSDVFLYEDNPLTYDGDIKRHHRWVRGDWQIAAWIFPFIPTAGGRLVRNKLSGLSKWKIFDNLRRSLAPLSLFLILVLGWFVLPFAWFWTLAVTIIVLLPVMIAYGWQLIHKPIDLSLKVHLNEIGVSIRNTLLRFVFDLAILPYEAYRYCDAIVRANWRVFIARRKLLEWTPSANVMHHVGSGLAVAYAMMWIAPVSAIMCVVFLYANPAALLVAVPILILWLIAPALVWWMGKPLSEKADELPEKQDLFLHTIARKTWSYFETFVTAEDHWLPPDNFQEQPVMATAHRTSPTNMGLALLANLSAYDFGYISGGELAVRCHNTLQSMQKLERYKGHFYNWYDTKSLAPLRPRYVSTVDSGNLAGHLLTLRQGLLALSQNPVFHPRTWGGLRTTVYVLTGYMAPHYRHLTHEVLGLLDSAEEHRSLQGVRQSLQDLRVLVGELAQTPTEHAPEFAVWIEKLLLQVEDVREDLIHLIPWVGEMPVPPRFVQLAGLDEVPSLLSLARGQASYLSVLEMYAQEELTEEESEWLIRTQAGVRKAANRASSRITLLDQIAALCEEMSTMEYDFLLDKSTHLLRIGYNADEQKKDNSFYDLLASEVRLGVFVGIAQGKLPQESWFALGRLLTKSGGEPILLSWSGSMFEYLMPQLVMPSYENTLLHQTSRATVKRQIEYAAQQGKPWGISESAYNMVDANMIYQYRAFGVPGLGFKRGLENDFVIAPYASMMALMILPGKACTNLQLLSELGFEGAYGFYEAIDYTASRLPRGNTHSVIQSYMAHHQGMGLLSLAYTLLDRPMQQRFVAELRFQATLLLLQERIPRATVYYAHTADLVETPAPSVDVQVRAISTPNTAMPEIQLLGNGNYQVMITNSGAGYSRWHDMAVTRWREDGTKDDRGVFCFIKDVNTGVFWSNTYQPTLRQPKSYEVIFSQGHAEFRRHDQGVDTRTEIVVSPEDDIEMRRVRIMNRTQSVKVLDITSYSEVVMAAQNADEAHPAFSNLFVQTEINPEYNAIFCTRRPRSEDEAPPWLVHLMSVYGATVVEVSYETDRMQFIGRGRSLEHPRAMDTDLLSGSEGAVLDPIVSVRYRIVLKPDQMATIDLIFGMGETRQVCEGLMYKYRDQHLKNRAFELSWTHSQVLLRQINATEADIRLYDRMAAAVIYANAVFRADPDIILNNYKGQSGLWSHSVSGDLPIVLLHIYEPDSLELVRQMVQAHAYWRLKGLEVDLIIWNEDHGSYRQALQEQILGLVTLAAGVQGHDRPGNIFVRSADQIPAEDRVLFESVARVIIADNKGTLTEQVNRISKEHALPPLLETRQVASDLEQTLDLPQNLLFFNGRGGFTPDGKEYKIIIDKENTTPAPWVNVIANMDFGSVVSESGSSYTWAVNAHAYRITPWTNDPVCDAGGEAFYIRDEETGSFWSPTPYPAAGDTPYVVTHGFGYSVFEHVHQNIASEFCVFVDKELPVKTIRLRVKNLSGRRRVCSATGFLEIILGDVRARTNMHIVSEYHAATGSLLFRNRYNTAFAHQVSFFRADTTHELSYTTDRTEFIGRNKNLRSPQAMLRKKLSGRTGACKDTCGALQVTFDLAAGEDKEVVFQIGSEGHSASAYALIHRLSGEHVSQESLRQVKEYWDEILGTVQVATPDEAINILANGWLLYQVLASRIFGRSGFYQSGGAFGFRDQLQDVLALLHTSPELTREQILLHASRQFPEGDVQHWWHPPEGRGVRTRCSDDLLWLPYVVTRYIAGTGDQEILNAEVGYLESRLLHHGEDSYYDLPVSGRSRGSLYEHCVRAIQHSLRFGQHGLPLIGSGDWNDGMDKVGHKGEGESVWLAFFLYDILTAFAQTAADYGDSKFAETCRKEAAKLQARVETAGWDGAWYLRAFFDDGTPLGSKTNSECRIDAIAQSWAVLSRAADRERAAVAMASLDKHLASRTLKIIRLLTPPFDSDGLNPGYIRGYVPGVRENGGQYSHAAIWALMAFAELGDREKVWELFSMIQPVARGGDEAAIAVYKVEPYVMAADVYANDAHKGRGGWTWYTGSAGWMYQFLLGSLLGVRLMGNQLVFKPCFPTDWPSVSLVYRYGRAIYRIKVLQLAEGVSSRWVVDDQQGAGNQIQLTDDGREHRVVVYVGRSAEPA